MWTLCRAVKGLEEPGAKRVVSASGPSQRPRLCRPRLCRARRSVERKSISFRLVKLVNVAMVDMCDSSLPCSAEHDKSRK